MLGGSRAGVELALRTPSRELRLVECAPFGIRLDHQPDFWLAWEPEKQSVAPQQGQPSQRLLNAEFHLPARSRIGDGGLLYLSHLSY